MMLPAPVFPSTNPMNQTHKNKTLATLLAAVLGGFGAHRFYLYGTKDMWAWLHVLFFPIAIFAGFIEALVIGLTPDDKWDAIHNLQSGTQSNSGWLLVVLLVLTTGLGATAVIATLARTFDLLYTGGAYG
jgi:TM2 domain-containing membrane protein YozV